VSSIHPAVPITSFTQEDINSGRIWFLHRGSPNGRLALRVSDGIETGATGVLRISAFDIQIFLANNSALTVPTNGSAILRKSNLAFSTNAPDQGTDHFEQFRLGCVETGFSDDLLIPTILILTHQNYISKLYCKTWEKIDLEISYEVKRSPQYGSIQLWKSSRWQNVSSFTSTQLKQDHIRYVHQHGHSNEDDFQFDVSVSEAQFSSPIQYQFRIEFLDPIITEIHNKGLHMTSVESVIDTSVIQYATSPYVTKDEDLIFTILQPPLFGTLQTRLCTALEWTDLNAGSTFTQEVVRCNGLRYRLQRRTLSPITDRFIYTVRNFINSILIIRSTLSTK